jgi:hypothetical protein
MGRKKAEKTEKPGALLRFCTLLRRFPVSRVFITPKTITYK